MTFTVHAPLSRVRWLLRERGIIPVMCDFEDENLTSVTLTDRDCDTFRLDCARFGIRTERGAPHNTAHADPTFARAAQHIAYRERGAA